MSKKVESEFGKGFIYPLVLYAKHIQQTKDYEKSINDYRYWFSGASDHLYELEVPYYALSGKLNDRIKSFQQNAIDYGHGPHYFECPVTKEQWDDMLKEFLDICFEIDKELGFNPVKADWE